MVIALTYTLSVFISCLFLNQVIKSHDAEVTKLIAVDVYDSIHNEILKAITISQTMAFDNFLKQNLKDESTIPREYEIALMTHYLRDIKSNSNLDSAFVVSESSKLYYTANGLKRTINPEKNPNDVWYKQFVDRNITYDFGVESDEYDRDLWTMFINSRIEDENGNLLGVCGIGVDIKVLQNILDAKERDHQIKIDLFEPEGNFAIDTRVAKFKDPYIKNIVLTLQKEFDSDNRQQFIFTNFDNFNVMARYIPEIQTYLIIRNANENKQGVFSELIFHMICSFATILFLLILFVRVNLINTRRKIEENAKKHGIASHAGLYVTMHLIDLEHNSIHELSRDLDVDLIEVPDGGNAARKIKNSLKEAADEKTLYDLMEFINFATLPERMTDNPAIHQEFLSKKYGWCKIYFMLLDNNEDGTINKVVLAIEIIQEEKQREENLRQLSETDAMTGLKNRGGGEKTIRHLMLGGMPGMFCLMDADKFKSINDNYGHGVGDKVIIAIAEAMKKTFRATDIIMRLGGDEFAMYALGVTDEERGNIVINRLFNEINAINIPELGERKITVSLGAAFFTVEEFLTFDDIYKRADLMTYESKKIQGNCHTFYKN